MEDPRVASFRSAPLKLRSSRVLDVLVMHQDEGNVVGPETSICRPQQKVTKASDYKGSPYIGGARNCSTGLTSQYRKLLNTPVS